MFRAHSYSGNTTPFSLGSRYLSPHPAPPGSPNHHLGGMGWSYPGESGSPGVDSYSKTYFNTASPIMTMVPAPGSPTIQQLTRPAVGPNSPGCMGSPIMTSQYAPSSPMTQTVPATYIYPNGISFSNGSAYLRPPGSPGNFEQAGLTSDVACYAEVSAVLSPSRNKSTHFQPSELSTDHTGEVGPYGPAQSTAEGALNHMTHYPPPAIQIPAETYIQNIQQVSMSPLTPTQNDIPVLTYPINGSTQFSSAPTPTPLPQSSGEAGARATNGETQTAGEKLVEAAQTSGVS